MFSAAAGEKVEVVNDPKHPNYHLRQKGKTLGFMINYGGSAGSLGPTLKIPVEEAQGLIDAFFLGFPKLKDHFEKCKKFALDKGYIITNPITNRRRWIPEWKEWRQLAVIKPWDITEEQRKLRSKLRGRIERKALNTPIQGTSGDITKTALLILRESLLKLGIRPTSDAPIKIVNVVHDECCVEAKVEYAETAAKLLQEAMEKAGKIFVKQIEMPALPKILDYWDH